MKVNTNFLALMRQKGDLPDLTLKLKYIGIGQFTLNLVHAFPQVVGDLRIKLLDPGLFRLVQCTASAE